MYGKFIRCLISQLVTPIKVILISSPPEYDGLHSDTLFCYATLVPEVIKEIATAANSMQTYYSYHINM